MACTPYDPTVGFFGEGYLWGRTGLQKPWSITFIGVDTLVLNKDGVEKTRLSIGGPDGKYDNNTSWIFFPTDFLAVTNYHTDGGRCIHQIWIFDLRGNDVSYRELGGGDWTTKTSTPPEIQISSDGQAFMIVVEDTTSSANFIKKYIVFRSDTLNPLCSFEQTRTENPAPRRARIAKRKVEIGRLGPDDNFTIDRSCDLPSGKCQTYTCEFDTVILDGPEARTSTAEAKLENIGDDCLQVEGISDVEPFKMEHPDSGSIFISKGGWGEVDLTFTPTRVDEFEEELPVSLTPEPDPSLKQPTVLCKGRARESLAACKLSLEKPVPDVVFGAETDNSSSNASHGSFIVTNSGSDLLKVEHISDSAHFYVDPQPDYSKLLRAGDELKVDVTFKPNGVGLFKEEMRVTCIPSNGDKLMQLSANARLPIPSLIAFLPEEPFATFCYERKKLTVDLSNTGEVPLTLDVTSTSPNFSFTPIKDPIPPNTPLEIFVWSVNRGEFSITITIKGSFHLYVDDTDPVIDKVLETSATVVVRGAVVLMPPDSLEPNDDYERAQKFSLPAPGPFRRVRDGKAGLTLHDCGGNDKDYFLLSYKPGRDDGRCTATTVGDLTLGLHMVTYPAALTVSTETDPVVTDEGKPFTRKLSVYKSDAYKRELVLETGGLYSVTCPEGTFEDNELYVVLSNPDVTLQGPIKYGISFEYQASRSELRGGAFIPAEFVKLKKYYEVIWRGDPPHDKYGEVVTVDDWCHGRPVIIRDMKLFIRKHLAYVSRPEVMNSLRKSMDLSEKAIMAAEYLSLAQTARATGLHREAEGFYEKSASDFSRAGLAGKQAGALRGLMGLYSELGMTDRATAVEKALAKVKAKVSISE